MQHEQIIAPTVPATAPVAAGAEKRKNPRYTIDISIKVRINSTGGVTSYCYGRGNNVSLGGLSIYVAHELGIGKTIKLILTLPHADRQIDCEAAVRNREGYRYGLEFVSMKPQDRELLDRACKMLGVLQAA